MATDDAFYIHFLNYVSDNGQLGTTGGVTVLDNVNFLDVQHGEALLSKCLSSFRFRSVKTDEGDQNAPFVIVGMPKPNDVIFKRNIGTSQATGLNYDNKLANHFCTMLAEKVFGHSDAADLFSNRTLLLEGYDNAIVSNIGQMNAETAADATSEIVTAMLSHTLSKQRFYLMYGAVKTGDQPTAGDYVGAYVKVDGSNPLRQATIDFTQNGDDIEKARLVTPAAGGQFEVGDEVIIGFNINATWAAHHMKIAKINSVQAHMLNGTLDVDNPFMEPSLTRAVIGFDKVNANYPNCTISSVGAGVGSGGKCAVHTNSLGAIVCILMTSPVDVEYSGTSGHNSEGVFNGTKLRITYDNTIMVAGDVNIIDINYIFDAGNAAAVVAKTYLHTDPGVALTTGGASCPFESGDNIRVKGGVRNNPAQLNIMGNNIDPLEHKYMVDFKVVSAFTNT